MWPRRYSGITWFPARWLPASEIAIRIDQTLTQDATGTMAYLQFEAMGVPRVKTELSVSYVDHNTLQTGFENADDHRFLQSVAAKYGIYFSRPGNGICHQVHLERFGAPGQDPARLRQPYPDRGGLGMLAIGAGGLDVAVRHGRRAVLYADAQDRPGQAHRATAAVGVGQGRHPGTAAPLDRQGRGRQDHGIRRRRGADLSASRARHHHQHGRGDWAPRPPSSPATTSRASS